MSRWMPWSQSIQKTPRVIAVESVGILDRELRLAREPRFLYDARLAALKLIVYGPQRLDAADESVAHRPVRHVRPSPAGTSPG